MAATADSSVNDPAVPNASEAIARYGQFGRDWIAGVRTGDRLADAVVADFARLPKGAGMTMLTDATQNGIDAVPDAPDSLKALFAQVDEIPEWVDWQKIDRASSHLLRHRAAYGITMGAAGLTVGATNSIAGRPLVLTGRYVSEVAVRSVETGSWIRDILVPGALRRDKAGFAKTLRVRTIHAFVRRHLISSGQWDTKSWGTPISQSYMAFTLIEFGWLALRAMRSLGTRLTDSERDDVYHLYRYVGHLIGVQPELNPVNEAEQIRVEQIYVQCAPGPEDSDREFVRALNTDYLGPEIARGLPGKDEDKKRRMAVGIVDGLTRSFVGDRAADELKIPDTKWKYAPKVIGPVLGTVNEIRNRIPGLNERRGRAGVAAFARELDEVSKRYGVTHDLVDTAPSDETEHPATAR